MEKYRPEIDGLRAIAIVSVVLFHAGAVLHGGFLGVDVFFVISGYLITQLIVNELDRGQFHFYNFWLRRARRILPALIIVTIFCLALGWFFLLPNDFRNLGRSAIALSAFSSNIYFWLKSGYFAPPAQTQPLLHTWSLSVEEQFYILFPALVYLLTRYAFRLRAWLIFLLMILSLILLIYKMKSDTIAAFFLLPTRAWELFLGSVVALHFANKKTYSMACSELLSVLGIMLIGCAVFFYNPNSIFPAWGPIAACLGTTIIIISNQNKRFFIGRVLSSPPLVGVGLISYSLYLWHWPFLVFAQYITANKLGFLQRMVIVAASFFMAWVSYRWIETPFRRKQLLVEPKKFITLTLALICILTATSFLINRENGVPDRLDPRTYIAYKAARYQLMQRSMCKRLFVSKRLHICDSNAPMSQKPDFVLWGDSHADMLKPVIKKLAKQYHVKFWSYKCIPLLDVYDVARSDSLRHSQCTTMNHALIQVIRQRHIKNVIFSSFWEQFVEGREVPLDGAGQRDTFYADANIKSTSAPQARAVFKKHFIDTIHALENAGVTHIWIVKDVPFFEEWPSNQLLKMLKYGGNTNQIGRPLPQISKREAFVNTVFNEVQSKTVRLIDPDFILCDKSHFCHGVKDKQSLYFDFNHLSYYGALQLSPLFHNMFAIISQESRHHH